MCCRGRRCSVSENLVLLGLRQLLGVTLEVGAHLGLPEVEAQLGLPEVQSRLPSDAICRERSPLGNGGASQGGALPDSPGALKSGRGASEIIME